MLPLLAFYFCTGGLFCSEIVLINIYYVSVFSEAVFSLYMNHSYSLILPHDFDFFLAWGKGFLCIVTLN